MSSRPQAGQEITFKRWTLRIEDVNNNNDVLYYSAHYFTYHGSTWAASFEQWERWTRGIE